MNDPSTKMSHTLLIYASNQQKRGPDANSHNGSTQREIFAHSTPESLAQGRSRSPSHKRAERHLPPSSHGAWQGVSHGGDSYTH